MDNKIKMNQLQKQIGEALFSGNINLYNDLENQISELKAIMNPIIDKVPQKWEEGDYSAKMYDWSWEVPRVEIYLNGNCIAIFHNVEELNKHQASDPKFYFILPEEIETIVRRNIKHLV